METFEVVKVWVVIDSTVNSIPCSDTCTAEELCIALCKKYKIPPLTRTLFALRVKGSNCFLKDNFNVLSGSREYEFRIRFKVPVLAHLITLDEMTYDYYFQQARNDVNSNSVPEIKYPDHKKELLGLGITDMFRAILEEKISLKDAVRNYKNHIPKVILRRHGHFPKKYALETIPTILVHDVNYVKSQYLQQMYTLAPNYLAEEYCDVQWQTGKSVVLVHLHVAPFHEQQPGLRLYNSITREWIHIGTIEEIIYLTRNGDNCLEVSRRGTPLFFKFKSEEELSSFISVCDGYYRLMVKWTFNLSKDDETPSLKDLHRLKCHGPVGTTETYRLEFKGDCYQFNNEQYYSLDHLVKCHQNPEGRIYLKECIPPSEYVQRKGVRIDQAELQEILKDNKSPRCLSTKDIMLYIALLTSGSGTCIYTYAPARTGLYASACCVLPCAGE
ncbi:Tyrosine-protein kinase hopscotch [Eumeta japonica]|uniref:Tyrosine-protein kinase hopscotch n=1 Tax=Eumeta variegata TaxID=151549 RepID=A0A4C1T328_EUMVA|nr:Tyrosine-protein kinase hopscotch [Eumeta japonica]